MRSCPLTGATMERRVLDGVEIDVSEGQGIWLDRSELLAITEARRRTRVPSLFETVLGWFREDGRPEHRGIGENQRGLRCPVCDVALVVDSYEDVTIDRCLEHGIWLDQGELELILERLSRDPAFVRGMTVRLRDAEL